MQLSVVSVFFTFPTRKRTIAEAFRVLKPGGRYAFTVWRDPEHAHLLALALKAVTAHADITVPLPPAPPMFQYSDPAAARAAVEKAGFVDVSLQVLPIEFTGQTPEDVFDWFDKSTVRTMALYRLQTPSVQRRIRKAILEGTRDYSSNGEIKIPCPAMLYQMQKP